MSKNEKERITLNALGTKFVISLEKLDRFSENSRLGKLRQFRSLNCKELECVCDDFDLQKNEFFFNRDPDVLKVLLNYAITGDIQVNSNICEVFVENEFKYWASEWKELKRCCKTAFVENLNAKTNAIKVDAQILNDLKLEQLESKTLSIFNRLSKIVENPKNSLAGRVGISLIF